MVEVRGHTYFDAWSLTQKPCLFNKMLWGLIEVTDRIKAFWTSPPNRCFIYENISIYGARQHHQFSWWYFCREHNQKTDPCSAILVDDSHGRRGEKESRGKEKRVIKKSQRKWWGLNISKWSHLGFISFHLLVNNMFHGWVLVQIKSSFWRQWIQL